MPVLPGIIGPRGPEGWFLVALRHLFRGAGTLEGLSSVLVRRQPLHQKRELLELDGSVLVGVVLCTRMPARAQHVTRVLNTCPNLRDGIFQAVLSLILQGWSLMSITTLTFMREKK